MKRLACSTIFAILAVIVCMPAAAQDSGFSIGVGASAGTVGPDSDSDLDITGWTLFGRWQHASKGWGAMAEFRDGEDDENFVDFDFQQINLYGTYTWLRDGLARPFVKVGASMTEIDFGSGLDDDDTGLILGGGVEVGRGRWAFHASLDATQLEFGNDDVDVTNLTLGAVVRF